MGDLVNIIVNSRPKKVPEGQITFEDVVALAFTPVPANVFFTVTFQHGNEGGSLEAGHPIPVRGGMKFHVTDTGQS
jgi:multiubiquitin